MRRTLALIGNPNSGKTTLFNALTGLARHVGNFPGVTVERTEGALRRDASVTLTDLPGTYSLTAATAEERVPRAYLLGGEAGAVINIVDGTCLGRGLYLTLQLVETGVPLVVAVNMMDEVRRSGASIDCAALSRALGVPVLPVSAARGEGVSAVAEAALRALCEAPRPAKPPPGGMEARILSRYARIETLLAQAVRGVSQTRAQQRSVRLDRVLTHPVLAFPIFFLLMGLVFYLTFGPVGGALSRVLRWGTDGLGGALSALLLRAGAAPWLRALILEGIFAGVGTVLSFLPTILSLFFFLSLLEDSGYMARMAFVTDRLLRRLGVSGRSFVPALLGFGCSVPAILSTRILPARRDRVLTILLIPFFSCSAKLPVYALFARAFFPGRSALVMLLLYAFGVLLGMGAALVLRRAYPAGEGAPFLLELPPYRLPTARSALMLVRARTAAFLRCALSTLLLSSLLLFALMRIDIFLHPVPPGDGSLLSSIGRALSRAFLPLGFGDWRAAAALLCGLLAKEAVLSSLGVLLHAGTDAALIQALQGMFTPLSAASFLVFTLLYMPCVAAFSAARRELGGFSRALFAAAFHTGLAWLTACVVYNAGRLVGFC